jgi:geranylgeranyl diphosphate synthase type II
MAKDSMIGQRDANLEQRLASIRERVDGRLGRLCPGEDVPPEKLHRSMRYSLLAPGKRIRPVITVLTAEALGAAADVALDPACAVEMVHTASLILDDLPFMDDAALRRGRPANHVEFGQDIATLAAVSLMNRAYAVLASAPGLEEACRLELVDVLARTIGDEGIVSGQVHDLHLTGQNDPGLAELERMAGQKTAALFVAGAELGARVAGVRGKPLESVRAFAWNLGLCFQVVDDLADLHGSHVTTGKDVGKDAAKATFVSLMGPERAFEAAERFARAAVRALDPIGPSADELDRLTDHILERTRTFTPHL